MARTRLDLVVIGGGAAGMMAALQAAWAGAQVVLLEKNEKQLRIKRWSIFVVFK